MSKKQFKDNGYCIVKNAVSKELRDFITQYVFFDEMQSDAAGDTQVPNSVAKYGDPAMESLLVLLKEQLENATGLTLDPTYSYYRIYGQGDTLEKHIDRPSCEISCTVCFNYSYDNYEWPIYMDGKPAVLAPGDMVVYRGMDLEHWRDALDIVDEDAWHVQGFFHYVDTTGPYKEFKWDKRESIGALL
jgi:hypothetical protein|tara:strand:+ start:2624 stop:3187 length:564 start_codon:yes stop_codon:yes gene_type:complete